MDAIANYAFLPATLAFLAMVLFVFGMERLWVRFQSQGRLRKLAAIGARATPSAVNAQEVAGGERLRAVLNSLSRLSLPKEGWQDDTVRRKFVRAGLDAEDSARIYYALKTVLVVVVPMLIGGIGALALDMSLSTIAIVILGLAAVGYYGPDLYLRRRTMARALAMRDALPDVLDLLVICTESGLGIDQAIGRVASEMAERSEIVASEFYLTTLEIRAGAGRSQAMRNLALRIDLEDLSSLAAMLIQADRFGTSIAEALRVQSELMRGRRMQRAEEAAAKVPTKILLPLILLVFPALMIVLLGPAVLRIMDVLGK